MDRYAIVGFGCAGYHGAKALRENGYNGEIHVYSDIETGPENPMLTTYYISGQAAEETCRPFGTIEEISEKLRLNMHIRKKAVMVNGTERTVITEDCECEHFENILIATGASPFTPAFEGADMDDIYVVRAMKDAERIRQRMERGLSSAVVVGASMIGIKIVELIRHAGADCLLLDMAARIFPLASLEQTAAEIERRLADRGVEQKYGVRIQEAAYDNGRIRAVFTDGQSVLTDMIVVCAGTRTNISIVDPADIRTDRGIIVNERMETSAAGVYAAGDCCQGNNLQSGSTELIGLWANAGCQGRTAGANMAGAKTACEGNILQNISHFMDMDFVSIGDNRIPGERRTYELKNGQLIELIESGGQISCLNMLGGYETSGIIKNVFMKRLRCGPFEADEWKTAMLLEYGVPAEIMGYLRGVSNE